MTQQFGRATKLSFRITTSTTTAVVAADAYLSSVNVTVSNAGTTWTIKVQDKSATPRIGYINDGTGVVIGTKYQNFTDPIPMFGGIDIVTAGTAGVMDVFITYFN